MIETRGESVATSGNKLVAVFESIKYSFVERVSCSDGRGAVGTLW